MRCVPLMLFVDNNAALWQRDELCQALDPETAVVSRITSLLGDLFLFHAH